MEATNAAEGTSTADATKATAHLRRTIELQPAFAPAYARLADIHEREGGRDEALALRRLAADLEPTNAAYWLDLGRLLSRMHRHDQARDAGRRGLAVARTASLRELAASFLSEVDRAREP